MVRETVFKSVGLVARFDKKKAIKLAGDLAEYLKNRGLETYIEDTLTGKVDAKGLFVPLKNMKADFIITIGGDGTVLRTCISIPKPEPPILTINMGVRGFLTEVKPEHALAAVNKCLRGEFIIERCMKLHVATDNVDFPDVLNEVLISANEPAKLLNAQVLKDGEPLMNCQADGLLIATQTGSTGYSLSAGGPVLDPGVNAFVLTPVCALSVFRSMVFPADSTVTIKVIKPKDVLVAIDGAYHHVLSSKLPRITITRSAYETSFIRFKKNFYHRLRNRLLFSKIGGKA